MQCYLQFYFTTTWLTSLSVLRQVFYYYYHFIYLFIYFFAPLLSRLLVESTLIRKDIYIVNAKEEEVNKE